MGRGLVLIIVVLSFLSCSRFEQAETGLQYKFHVKNENNRPIKEGELALCYYTINYGDTCLYNTYLRSDPARVVVRESGYKGDLFEALALMHEGDSATFLFDADSFYTVTNKVQRPEIIKTGDDIEVKVKIFKVLDEDEFKLYLKKEEMGHIAQEKKDIQAYIKENYLMMDYDSSLGICYRVKRKDSAIIMQEDIVSFQCLGRTTKGKTIINTYTGNMPLTVQVGHENYRLPIIDELLQFMGEGDDGKFIVPYMNCFGPGGDGAGIPQYSTFVFDIFVEKVRK
jgi:FKBP-type peptidyl-prolyl cis-trans isomerase